MVLIDGDGTVFLPSLIAEGKHGGRKAGGLLSKSIGSYFPGQLFKLHVYVFLHKSGLAGALIRNKHKNSANKLEEFLIGFNQTASLFSAIDVGKGKEAADNKMRGAHLFLP